MPRKLIRAGFGRAGITDKATKRKVRKKILSGKKRVGLGKLGVTRSQRKTIKENVVFRNKVKKRRAARAQRNSAAATLKRKSDALRSIPRTSRDGPR